MAGLGGGQSRRPRNLEVVGPSKGQKISTKGHWCGRAAAAWRLGVAPPTASAVAWRISWERGRPARILLLLVVAELPRGFAGSHYVGSNHNGQAEGEPGRRCRSIQVEEMPEAVPVICKPQESLPPRGGVGERAEPAVEPEGGKRGAP